MIDKKNNLEILLIYVESLESKLINDIYLLLFFPLLMSISYNLIIWQYYNYENKWINTKKKP